MGSASSASCWRSFVRSGTRRCSCRKHCPRFVCVVLPSLSSCPGTAPSTEGNAWRCTWCAWRSPSGTESGCSQDPLAWSVGRLSRRVAVLSCRARSLQTRSWRWLEVSWLWFFRIFQLGCFFDCPHRDHESLDRLDFSREPFHLLKRQPLKTPWSCASSYPH